MNNNIIRISRFVEVFPEVKGFLVNPASINIAASGGISVSQAEALIKDIQEAIDVVKNMSK